MSYRVSDICIDGHVEAEFRTEGNAQPRHVQITGRVDGNALGITRVRPGDGLEKGGHIADRAPHGSQHGNAPERLGEAGAVGDGAERRLEADHAGMRGRSATRAAAVGAESYRREVCCERCRIAAGRAARCEPQVERVTGHAVQRAVGDALAGELGTIADADDDRTGAPQPRHGNGILRGDVVGEEPRALGDASAGDPDVVLDDDGHAGQSGPLAGRDPRAHLRASRRAGSGSKRRAH